MRNYTLSCLVAVSQLILASRASAIAPPENPAHPHNESDFQKGGKYDQYDQRKNETNSDHIFVHLVPHSHDDVGWLKTPDEYFTGSRQDIQIAMVEDTITTAVEELVNDENKRYTQVEMKFFTMWWERQSE